MRKKFTAWSVERDGFASGLALVIHASRRRIKDLSIVSFMLGELLGWKLPGELVSLEMGIGRG